MSSVSSEQPIVLGQWNALSNLRRVKKTRNLLSLRGESGQTILINTVKSKPLLVRRGGSHVEHFCDTAHEIRELASLLEKYPQERELLALLLSHHILVDDADEEAVPTPCLPADATPAPKEAGNDAKPHVKLNEGTRSGMTLYLLLSQGCNLRCIYCSNGTRTYQRSSHLMMPDAVAFRSIELCLKSLASGGRLQIVFFGGEPLLNWPLVKRCILRCEDDLRGKYGERQVHYHLTTNLTIFPEDMIEWADRYRISFLVDLDGHAAHHNVLRPFPGNRPSYSAIVDNIKRLVDHGLEVALRATITSHNVNEMSAIARHHLELGGAGTALVPLTPVNSDEVIMPKSWYPEPKRFVRGLKEIFSAHLCRTERIFPLNECLRRIDKQVAHTIACGAPYGNTPTVAVNGDVYPCSYWVGIERLRMFNVFDPDPFANSVGVCSGLMHQLHVDNIPKCSRCQWRYMCGGGCPVHRILVHSNPDSPPETVLYSEEIVCETFRQMTAMLLWDRAMKRVEDLEQLADSPSWTFDQTSSVLDSRLC